MTGAFADLVGIIATLRTRCPWDRKQTWETLKDLTVEEVYELGDAVLKNDGAEVMKELGDLIMHMVFYAQIGQEKGLFDMTDVLEGICEKLRYRHPHIYGTVSVADEQEVSRNWEKLKLKEKGRGKRVLEGVPSALPALIKSFRIQDKARGVGFDWKERDDVWHKVEEELAELKTELAHGTPEAVEEEFGDFLFSIVNAARLYGVNPENALEKTNRKFIRRFGYMEEQVLASGRSLPEVELEEMDRYWNEAKNNENSGDAPE